MSDILKWLRIAPPDESHHVREARGALWIKLKEAADEIEKLRAALQTARRDALEEAARVVEGMSKVFHPSQVITDRCAAAIRALKGEGDE